MEGVKWDEISEARRNKFESKIRNFARSFQTLNPNRFNLKTKAYFMMGKKLQEGQLKKLPKGETPSVDLQYWIDQGWVQVYY